MGIEQENEIEEEKRVNEKQDTNTGLQEDHQKNSKKKTTSIFTKCRWSPRHWFSFEQSLNQNQNQNENQHHHQPQHQHENQNQNQNLDNSYVPYKYATNYNGDAIDFTTITPSISMAHTHAMLINHRTEQTNQREE